MKRAITFSPVDTLFFRGGTPFNAGDAGFVQSIFPPTGSTAYGATRAYLLSLYCEHLSDYIRNGCDGCPASTKCSIRDVVGSPEERDGSLDIFGPYIHVDGNLYFPAPVDLAMTKNNDGKHGILYGTIVPKDGVLCDMGTVRLPLIHSDGKKTLNPRNVLFPIDELIKYLEGKDVSYNKMRGLRSSSEDSANSPLVYDEVQVGLALEEKLRVAREHYLYAVELVRPIEELDIWVGVDGIGSLELAEDGVLLRFGGEGKMAYVQPNEALNLPTPNITDELSETGNLKVMLLQHADFSGGWLPPGFEPCEKDGISMWHGAVGRFEMDLVTASIAPPVYVGGWNTAAQGSRSMKALVPAGSVYYLEVDPEQAVEIVKALHGSKIGFHTNLGYGHIALGVWRDE